MRNGCQKINIKNKIKLKRGKNTYSIYVEFITCERFFLNNKNELKISAKSQVLTSITSIVAFIIYF